MPTLIMKTAPAKLAAAALLALTLAGCASPSPVYAPPRVSETRQTEKLLGLPAPASALSVAVYQFDDLTGQRRRNETYADISSAVTQGGGAFLVKSLRDAGRGRWFTVVERQGVEHLLQERQIIRSTRDQFGEKEPLPPLRFAGLIIEGGITAYETNTTTGGFGARILGIGGSTEFRRDQVTVSLRAVSVATGEVVSAVNTSKSIYSAQISANVFRYVSEDSIFELDAGLAINEPVQIAVREAIERAVLDLAAEGTRHGLWSFASETDKTRVLALSDKSPAPARAAAAAPGEE